MAVRLNLPEWKDQDYVETLSKKFDCDAYSNNDAVIQGYGLVYFFKGDLPNKLIYITWGTGIGGIIINKLSNETLIERIDWKIYMKLCEELYSGKALSQKYKVDLFQCIPSIYINYLSSYCIIFC